MNKLILTAVTSTLAIAASSQAATLYSSSFEGTDGGFVAGGVPDWQRGVPGTYTPSAFPNRTNGKGGINRAATGNELWATVLVGPHNNGGASATLSRTFDFTSAIAPISLGFNHYLDSGGNTFDMASVQANGVNQPVNGTAATVFSGTVGSYTAAAGVTFAPATIDLSSFAGQSNVVLNFNFLESTVVARDGWYIDDVVITDGSPIPEPASLSALAAGALLLGRRRRA